MVASPKTAIALGLGFVALCVAAGFLMGSDADEDQVQAVNSFQMRLQLVPPRSGAEGRYLAEELNRVGPELSATALTHEGGNAVLMIRQPRMKWQKLIGQGVSYFKLKIPDATGSFSARWRAGLHKEFGEMNRDKFTPFRGHIRIRMKKNPPPSVNVLDYVDFSFSRATF